MIPLVRLSARIKAPDQIVHRVAAEVAKEKKTKFNYPSHHDRIPRAALVADEIAEDAEFFSFGDDIELA